MIKLLHRLIDIINGKITERDPELVRRLREGLNVSEIKKIKDGLFETYHVFGIFPDKLLCPYNGVECGEAATINYIEIINHYGRIIPDLTYKERNNAITQDLITRRFHNPLLRAIKHYIILKNREVDTKLGKATYQGVALTRFLSDVDQSRIDRVIFNLDKFQLEEIQYS